MQITNTVNSSQINRTVNKTRTYTKCQFLERYLKPMRLFLIGTIYFENRKRQTGTENMFVTATHTGNVIDIEQLQLETGYNSRFHDELENSNEDIRKLVGQVYTEMIKDQRLMDAIDALASETLENPKISRNPIECIANDFFDSRTHQNIYQEGVSYESQNVDKTHPSMHEEVTRYVPLLQTSLTTPRKRCHTDSIYGQKNSENDTYCHGYSVTQPKPLSAGFTHQDAIQDTMEYPLKTSIIQSSNTNADLDNFKCVTMDFQANCYTRWTEIVRYRNEERLAILLNTLEFQNQPTELANYVYYVNFRKSESSLYGFPLKFLLISNTYIIDELNTEYQYIATPQPMAYQYKTSLPISLFQSKHFTTNECIRYFVEYVRYICFDIHANSSTLIPKRELLNIVEYLPEFFHYLLFKTEAMKTMIATDDTRNTLYSELINIVSLVNLFDSRNNNTLHQKRENHKLVIKFRYHVLSYLIKFHAESAIRYFYFLCDIIIDKEKLCKVTGNLYIFLSLCFTYDFSNCTSFFKERCISIDTNKYAPPIVDHIHDFLRQNFLKKRVFNRALYKMIELHEQTVSDVFGAKNFNLLYFPNTWFVLVVKILGNSATIYVIRKSSFGTHLINTLMTLTNEMPRISK